MLILDVIFLFDFYISIFSPWDLHLHSTIHSWLLAILMAIYWTDWIGWFASYWSTVY